MIWFLSWDIYLWNLVPKELSETVKEWRQKLSGQPKSLNTTVDTRQVGRVLVLDESSLKLSRRLHLSSITFTYQGSLTNKGNDTDERGSAAVLNSRINSIHQIALERKDFKHA